MVRLSRLCAALLLVAPAEGILSRSVHNMTLGSFRATIKRQLLASMPPDFATEIAGVPSGPLKPEGPECNITGAENCSIDNFTKGVGTMVYPNGLTRCLNGEPFGFEVVPGDTTKLMINFQGGGACWDDLTTFESPMCKQMLSPSQQYGFWNTCSDHEYKNPFKKFTVVNVQYCSGDAFLGNREKIGSTPMPQVGFQNAKATFAWIDANLGTDFEYLVISGTSAGSLALAAWPIYLLRHYTYKQADIFADSYVGIFPKGMEGPILKDLKGCMEPEFTTGFEDEILEPCKKGKLTYETGLALVLKEYDVSYNLYSSRWDQFQIFFYQMGEASMQARAAAAYCKGVENCDMSQAPPELTQPVQGITRHDFAKRTHRLLRKLHRMRDVNWFLLDSDLHMLSEKTFGTCKGVAYPPEFEDGTKRRMHPQAWIVNVLNGGLGSCCEEGLWENKPDTLDGSCDTSLGALVFTSSAAGGSLSLLALALGLLPGLLS